MKATIVKSNTIESQINTLLHTLTAENKFECLELIMSLEPEYRMAFLNRFVTTVASIEDDLVEFEYALAA